jgi:hypothetical protein
MWLDSALSLSVRELDRMIDEQRDAAGVKIRAWLTQDQAAVWENALEVCRRLTGEDLDVGRCLELIAGEFLATYAYLAYRKEENECSQDAGPAELQETEDTPSEKKAASVELQTCPDNDDLPFPTTTADYGKTWREVLERDAYRCQYPDCGTRRELHVHHIRFRSHNGKKGRARSNSPQNLVTVCVFHHRMIHAGTIGVRGEAPSQLTWRRPALMEDLLERYRIDVPKRSNQLVREPAPVYTLMNSGREFGKRFPKSDLSRTVALRASCSHHPRGRGRHPTAQRSSGERS